MNRKIAVALAAVLGLSSLALQSASANDLTRVLGRLGLRSGSVNGVNQATIESNIQIGMTNLNNQIQQAQAQGRLSPGAAASLNAQMDRIAQMDASFRIGGYTGGEVQQLLSEFSRMNDMVANSIGNTTVGTYYNGYYGGNGYGRLYGSGLGNTNYSAVLEMENRVGANLATSVANGSIDASTGASLRAQLVNLQMQLRGFRTMSVARRNSLLRQLANLDQRVTDIAGGGFYY